LVVSDAAKQAVAEVGYDPAYGARPLKRAITTYLMNPMSKAIVSGGYGAGDTVEVDYDGEKLTFKRIAGPEDDEPEVRGHLAG
jgi:ATP-dependent Clp protease ATP-binding subunit ClpB